MLYPPARPDRFIVTQTEPTTTPRVVFRQTPEPTSTTTIIRQPTPTSYLQVPNPRTTRIVQVRQAPSPVVIDVDTPPLTTTKKTTIINDNRTDTLIDDRRTLVNYQDDYYATRRTGRRSDWCGNCGADCCGCSCFDDCCGTTNCCRTNSFARRKDVASYRTRVTKDGRRVRYRVSTLVFPFCTLENVFNKRFTFTHRRINIPMRRKIIWIFVVGDRESEECCERVVVRCCR